MGTLLGVHILSLPDTEREDRCERTPKFSPEVRLLGVPITLILTRYPP